MNENNAAMSAVWNRLSDHITKKETEIKGFSADELMASHCRTKVFIKDYLGNTTVCILMSYENNSA